MAGAPSQLELFDNKPLLTELEGQPLPRVGDWWSTLCVHSPRCGRPRTAIRVRAARQLGAPKSRRPRRIWPRWPTTSASSARCTPTNSTTPGPAVSEQRFLAAGPSLARFVGALRPGSTLSENLPAYIVMSTGGGLSGGAACGRAASCPTSTRACDFGRGRSDSQRLKSRGCRARLQQDTFDLVNRLNRQSL